MDERAIGVFDSGLGGLTTVKRLMELLPGEDIIYLGDTGRVPYGSRSRETIIKYTCQAAEFLSSFDIKTMVIACNTASTCAYEILERSYDIPIYEVVSAPVETAIATTKNNKIGVIGTAATIKSGAYEIAIKSRKSEIAVFSEACPLFVPLVENGRYASDDVAALAIAEDYLLPIRQSGADTLILGCTHYPLLRDVISKIMGENVELIDSGAQTAKLVADDLLKKNMLSYEKIKGTIKYFVTDSTEGFSDFASRYLESNIYGMVEQIVLE
ncbi:MAG: glutamate racemase [Oscillospiraceae bacterium]|nr:glutamate racemase [Oscillospiraceae bacterium]